MCADQLAVHFVEPPRSVIVSDESHAITLDRTHVRVKVNQCKRKVQIGPILPESSTLLISQLPRRVLAFRENAFVRGRCSFPIAQIDRSPAQIELIVRERAPSSTDCFNSSERSGIVDKSHDMQEQRDWKRLSDCRRLLDRLCCLLVRSLFPRRTRTRHLFEMAEKFLNLRFGSMHEREREWAVSHWITTHDNTEFHFTLTER